MATKALADKINKNRQEKDQQFEVLESIVQEQQQEVLLKKIVATEQRKNKNIDVEIRKNVQNIRLAQTNQEVKYQRKAHLYAIVGRHYESIL